MITVEAERTTLLYRELKDGASGIGRKINSKRTQVLCISSSTESRIDVLVCPSGDTEMESGLSLKIVGF